MLDAPIPHIILQSNSARRLKTDSSERRIPLMGASLWTVTQTFEVIGGADENYLFPRYTKSGEYNANSARAALNKWMKNILRMDV